MEQLFACTASRNNGVGRLRGAKVLQGSNMRANPCKKDRRDDKTYFKLQPGYWSKACAPTAAAILSAKRSRRSYQCISRLKTSASCCPMC